ncbi:MAG: hypothetical protein H6581_22400 [Bacteroidia bacterium]|nr:hypothetical protein [Bacteroidia bacterium]
MNDLVPEIIEALKSRACAKQQIYRNTLATFQNMKTICQALVEDLSNQFKDIDPSVVIDYHDTNEFEFQVKFSGDLLVFTMHSNVVTFPETHILFKSPYIRQDDKRKYFGHIMVYNFMADSVKYNRLDDPGYLMARLLINLENKFYIEGVRPLNFLHPDIEQNDMDDDFIRSFIQSAMLSAIHTDLQAQPFQQIQVIALAQIVANQMVGFGEKVGFKMSLDRDNQ